MDWFFDPVSFRVTRNDFHENGADRGGVSRSFGQWIWRDRDPVLTWDRGRNDEWDVPVLTGRTCEGDCLRYRSFAATVPGDRMQTGQPGVAGIDVHNKMLAVVVRWERELHA